MDPGYWERELRDAERLDGLLELLGDIQGLPVAFMVGLALSLPAVDGLPGVPGIDGCVEIARDLVSRRRPKSLTKFDSDLQGKEGSEKYAAAFASLQRIGQDQANEVVRQATLWARTPDAQPKRTDALTELDLDGWALSRGTRVLGELLVKFRERYPGPVLTTNFDPLLSVAVERAGGRANRVVFVKDHDPPSRAELRADETQIIHLHGYWRDSDTMHTMGQLRTPRDRLERWCEEVLRDRLLLVVGYGGWDDVFTRMIGSLADPRGMGLQVAWAFYSDRPSEIIGNYARLLERFEQWRAIGRLRIYVGIDAHVLFERLLEQVRDKAEVVEPSTPLTAAAAALAVVVPAEKAPTERYLRVVESPSTEDGDHQAVDEEEAAGTATHDPNGWGLLSAQQREWLESLVVRLAWLLDGGPGPWSYSARPELSRPTILKLRLPKVDEVLNDLGSIRPEEWADMEWALRLDEARSDAETIVEGLNMLPETLPPRMQDPPSREWNELVDALEHALAGILEHIRLRYPQAGPGH